MHVDGFSPPGRALDPLPSVRRQPMRGRALLAVGTALTLLLPACGGGRPAGTTTTAASTTSATSPRSTPPRRTGTPSGTAAPGHDLARAVGDGVVRISTIGCGEPTVGSGLLVSPTTVLTVHHVVHGGAWFAVRSGRHVAAAEVVADDPNNELALLKLDRPLHGHVFSFATSRPHVGSAAYVLGYPGGRPLSQTTGTVSGLDRRLEIADEDLRHLVQFDAAAAPGNSGGPLVNDAGAVIGLTEGAELYEQNSNYAISGQTAHAFVEVNDHASDPMDVTTCDFPGYGVRQLVRVDSDAPESWDVAAWLAKYFGAINSEDYDSAWNSMTRRMRGAYDGVGEFAEAELSSTVLDVHVVDVDAVDDLTDRARVAFASLQDAAHAPTGTSQTCSIWAVTYDLRLDSGWWQIDRARLTSGPPQQCTATQQQDYEAKRARLLQDQSDGDSAAD